MPAASADELVVGATLPREDPRDAVLLPSGSVGGEVDEIIERLGASPVIGTSSIRRVAQLRNMFPNASFTPIRGNVDTRLRKLDAGEYHAIVLAMAGVRRLGLGKRISCALPLERSVPAPGQGIVAVEHRHDRREVGEILARINDPDSTDALRAEREFVRGLGGGCQMPIGALAQVNGNELHFTGVVLAPDGSRAVRAESRGPRHEAAALGAALAETLLGSGARVMLDAARRAQ